MIAKLVARRDRCRARYPGGEERLEGPAPDFFAHAGAVVLDLDANGGLRSVGRLAEGSPPERVLTRTAMCRRGRPASSTASRALSSRFISACSICPPWQRTVAGEPS